MSRIGKLPIPIPEKVELKIDGQTVHVKGPLGELSHTFVDEVEVVVEDGVARVNRRGETTRHRAMHGLSRSLLANMVEGVSVGFEKILLVVGVGYTAEKKGSGVMLRVGFSHPVWMGAPPGITFELLMPSQWAEAGVTKQ
ncbi:MAG TPA: 50S ribosomal protein L6, partial [Bacteroidetes bacterium]|nr:50S ribosomal protein L6 [Bacteroidota bacterium]